MRLAKDRDEDEIELFRKLIDLFAEGEAIPTAVSVDEVQGTLVPAVCEGPQHAHDRRDADPTGDEEVPLGLRMTVDTEGAVGGVEVGDLSGAHLRDAVGEVPKRLDGEGEIAALGARGEREGVLLQVEGGVPEGEPGELPRLELEPLVPLGSQHEGPGAAALLDELGHAVGAAQLTRRIVEAHIGEGAETAHPDQPPQGAFPADLHVVPHPHDVQRSQYDGDHGQQDVPQAPVVVLDAELFSRKGGDHQGDHREERSDAGRQVPGGVGGPQQDEHVRRRDEEKNRVGEEKQEGDDRRLPVEIVDDVDAEGGGGVLKAGGQQEHHRHHRQRSKAQGEAEVPKKPLAGRRRPDEKGE